MNTAENPPEFPTEEPTPGEPVSSSRPPAIEPSPESTPVVWIVRQPVTRSEIERMAAATFGEMVKAVVDVERSIMAVGGELHADAEAELLADGSRQTDLWGINIYPHKSESDYLEYTSLINLRPCQGNRSQEIESWPLRRQIQEIVANLVTWDTVRPETLNEPDEHSREAL